MSFWEWAGPVSLGLLALTIFLKFPRISCRLGLHRWIYPQAVAIMPGMMRRGCHRCGRIDYHPAA